MRDLRNGVWVWRRSLLSASERLRSLENLARDKPA
jgi:hypothetical protein